ncbi:MAG: Vgb family protein [Pyrinomonadaceae bacterium]
MKYGFKTEKFSAAFKILGGLFLISNALLMSACGLDQKGMVLMTDTSWRASVVGTAEKDGFTVPDGLLWKQGKLYMADEAGGAFRVWTNSTDVKTFCDSNNSGIMSPEDLVLDAQGNAFFTDDDAGGVWEVDNRGKCFELAGKDKGLISTEGIALSRDGKILVGDGERHQVYSVTRTGEVSVFLGADYGIKKAESMVYDDKGNLYIADNDDNILYLLTPDMKLHRPLENQPNFSPETIWFSRGVLYITDSQNGKLFSYTPEEGLRTIAVFGGKLTAVCGITTDDNGSIYLSIQTNLKKHQGYILRLDKDTAAPLAAGN